MLRVGPFDDKPGAEPLYMAAPIPEDETKLEQATVIFARVVGVNIDANEKATVTLRYDDGGSGEFVAGSDILTKSAALIAHLVEDLNPEAPQQAGDIAKHIAPWSASTQFGNHRGWYDVCWI